MDFPRPGTFAMYLALVCAPPSAGRQPRVSPAALGHITDQVLNALLPEHDLVSGVSVAQRKLVFDFQRTMAAFARVGTPAGSFRDLHLRRPVELGGKDLLDDCSQMGGADRPCTRLGSRVYTWIEPLSVTDSQLVVRAYCMWPDRGEALHKRGVTPRTRLAFLVGFADEVYFVRTSTGEWKFSKIGTRTVS